MDLRRAVIERAVVWGWHVGVHPFTARNFGTPWADIVLIRGRDRRLVFGSLLSDNRDARPSPRKQLVMELLGSLQWNDVEGERQLAERLIGHSVPSIEAYVWRPSDLVAGRIDDVLR